ncbi:hypothetical protein EYF80_044855 [Liparis tanakae]|uniref:Uncharacterized protein n=1 Tax=Liparis tanakae TaxID=230148 RepID=A0A4Z2FVK3_9TELE|nr:hypothetical protein EYF80_044855 [Liparis tanakae]
MNDEPQREEDLTLEYGPACCATLGQVTAGSRSSDLSEHNPMEQVGPSPTRPAQLYTVYLTCDSGAWWSMQQDYVWCLEADPVPPPRLKGWGAGLWDPGPDQTLLVLLLDLIPQLGPELLLLLHLSPQGGAVGLRGLPQPGRTAETRPEEHPAGLHHLLHQAPPRCPLLAAPLLLLAPDLRQRLLHQLLLLLLLPPPLLQLGGQMLPHHGQEVSVPGQEVVVPGQEVVVLLLAPPSLLLQAPVQLPEPGPPGQESLVLLLLVLEPQGLLLLQLDHQRPPETRDHKRPPETIRDQGTGLEIRDHQRP